MENVSYNSILAALKNIPFDMIIHVLLILILGILIIRITRAVLKKVFLRNTNPQNQMLINKLVNYSGFIILLIIIMSEIGIQLNTILGAAGIMGIALGVASQKSLGNIISGFFMVTEKSFEIGDVITVGDKTGVVYSVELLSIMLKTFDNLLIRIPHETLISTDIINITRFPIRRMDIFITVSFDEDINNVLEILKNSAKNNAHCLDEPNPFLLVKKFDESGVQIQFGIWFEKTGYVVLRNSIMADILSEFKAAGITITYPHITIQNDLSKEAVEKSFVKESQKE